LLAAVGFSWKVENKRMMSVRSEIIAQFRQVAEEQERQLGPLSDSMGLLDSGLDSLCFAIIVVRLEDLLGFDPFKTSGFDRSPVTLGDFISLYEHAAK
jgi:acyl carrier protein